MESYLGVGFVEISHQRHHHKILRCVIVIVKDDSVERWPLQPLPCQRLGLARRPVFSRPYASPRRSLTDFSHQPIISTHFPDHLPESTTGTHPE